MLESTILSSLYALPFYDFDLRASHARTLLPAALASVPFGFVLVRVRVALNFIFAGSFGHEQVGGAESSFMCHVPGP